MVRIGFRPQYVALGCNGFLCLSQGENQRNPKGQRQKRQFQPGHVPTARDSRIPGWLVELRFLQVSSPLLSSSFLFSFLLFSSLLFSSLFFSSIIFSFLFYSLFFSSILFSSLPFSSLLFLAHPSTSRSEGKSTTNHLFALLASSGCCCKSQSK